MAAKKTFSREQRLERVARVSEMYLELQSMTQIARQLGLSTTSVYRDICVAREQWRTRAGDAIEEHKKRELAKIDQVELEAWRGWQRTIGVHRIETRKNTTVEATRALGDGGSITVDIPAEEIVNKREKLAGDPRFLEIITRCIESRRKILGLDAPAQVTGAAGGPVRFVIEGIGGAQWLPPMES